MIVKAFKLCTGEEIVGQVVTYNEDCGYYELQNVVTPQIIDQKFALVPFPMLMQKCRLYHKDIMLDGEPRETVLNAYNAEYGSGLVVAHRIPKPYETQTII